MLPLESKGDVAQLGVCEWAVWERQGRFLCPSSHRISTSDLFLLFLPAPPPQGVGWSENRTFIECILAEVRISASTVSNLGSTFSPDSWGLSPPSMKWKVGGKRDREWSLLPLQAASVCRTGSRPKNSRDKLQEATIPYLREAHLLAMSQGSKVPWHLIDAH